MYYYVNAVILHSLNWTLLSQRTSLDVEYRVNCVTRYADPLLVKWLKNEEPVLNSSAYAISHQVDRGNPEVYDNILSVKGSEHNSTTIVCRVSSDERMNLTLEGIYSKQLLCCINRYIIILYSLLSS